MAITRPEVAPAWADGVSASPDIVRPSDGFIGTGWPLSAIPPSRGYFNWILKFCANGIRHLCNRGIADWDAAEPYLTGAMARGPDGNIYVCTGQASLSVAPGEDLSNWRLLVDRGGFTMGRQIRWAEQWNVANTKQSNGTLAFDLETRGWSAVLVTALTGPVRISTSFDDGTSGLPGTGLSSVVTLKSLSADVGDSARLTKSSEFKFTTSSYLALEWDCWPGTIPAQMQMFGGPGSGLPSAGNLKGAYFVADSGGVWKVVCGDGTAVSSFVSTGVSIATSVWQRVRVELIGSAVNPAGVTQAKFYIDGNLVATITSALPTGQVIGTTFGFTKVSAGAENMLSFIGPVRHARSY